MGEGGCIGTTWWIIRSHDNTSKKKALTLSLLLFEPSDATSIEAQNGRLKNTELSVLLTVSLALLFFFFLLSLSLSLSLSFTKRARTHTLRLSNGCQVCEGKTRDVTTGEKSDLVWIQTGKRGGEEEEKKREELESEFAQWMQGTTEIQGDNETYQPTNRSINRSIGRPTDQPEDEEARPE